MLSGMRARGTRRLAIFVGVCLCLCLLWAWRAGSRRFTADPAPAPAPARDQAGQANGRTLTVTFWNVDWFPGRRPGAGARAQASHVAAVVPVVEQLDPDVLGLEEVSDLGGAHLIADHLKGFRVDACTEFTRPPDNAPSRQQTVLCSRLPLLEAGWEPWKPDANGLQPRRGFVFAAYQPAPGEVLLVYGVHLKSNVPDEPGGPATNTAMREESVRQWIAHERATAARVAAAGRVRLAVIGGDMNTSLDDVRFEAEQSLRVLLRDGGGFLWAWDGVPLDRRISLPGRGQYPPVCFDHVFYRADGGVRLRDCAVEPTGPSASDHRPVTARFAW